MSSDAATYTIAAQAIALELTLVSNNRKEFARVPGLAIENCARERR